MKPLTKDALEKLTLEQRIHRFFVSYIALQYPDYRFSPHNQIIASRLQELEAGDIRRLMIFMPPRHGKTMQVSEYFPAWYLGSSNTRATLLRAQPGPFECAA